MLRFAAIAAFGALSALGASQALGALEAHQQQQLEQQQPQQPGLRPAVLASDAAPPDGEAAASISKARDGHYWAEADVDGRSVRFLVDTGATEVALTSADAERLGLDTHSLDYSYAVTTASGKARAARVQLARVSVAGALVRDVDALVIDHGLPTSLLGMTYLGRLSRFEATPTALILRP